MSQDPTLHIIYLSYGLRALAIIVGALFVWQGTKLLEGSKPSLDGGEIEGSWGALSLTLRNAPVGTILTVLGTIVVITPLVVGRFDYTREYPDGGSTVLRAPAYRDSVQSYDTLIFLSDPDSLRQLTTTASEAEVGSVIQDSLSFQDNALAGRRIDCWKTVLGNQEAVQATLESGDFDSYLYVLNEDFEVVGANDDYGQSRNSRVEFEANYEGTYFVCVTSYASSTGEYVLELSNQ